MTNQATPDEILTDPGLQPGIARRFAAICYDCLLLFAVLFAATALLLPFIDGDVVPANAVYSAYLVAITFGYFGGFWTHGGQTLGMRTWRLKVIRIDGDALRWSDALARFLAAMLSCLLLGTGFLWALIDRDRLMAHDRWSKTLLILV